jgi:putative endonuclease
MKKGYVYIVANFTRSTLYTGVTSNLPTRIRQHRDGKGSKFTSKYNARYLMYFEEHENIEDAIHRETQIKNWRRQWKFDLINSINPDMKDLWEELA